MTGLIAAITYLSVCRPYHSPQLVPFHEPDGEVEEKHCDGKEEYFLHRFFVQLFSQEPKNPEYFTILQNARMPSFQVIFFSFFIGSTCVRNTNFLIRIRCRATFATLSGSKFQTEFPQRIFAGERSDQKPYNRIPCQLGSGS